MAGRQQGNPPLDALVVDGERRGQDQPSLPGLLTEYRAAGLGGVEICPIYGAKGYESNNLDFLSPKWMDMLAHTTTEAKRLDFGVDLTTGTGWPFGGPEVNTDDASARVNMRHYDLSTNQSLTGSLPVGKLQCLIAISDQTQTDLVAKVNGGKLDWVLFAWSMAALCREHRESHATGQTRGAGR